VKSPYCAAHKLRGTFDQCSSAVKNTLFRAYTMPIYSCQWWSKYTQTSMKHVRAAYNKAFRTVHCIPRNVRVCPHQVIHRITAFDTLLRNDLYRFSRCASSSNFYIRYLHISDAFYKSLFFLNYLRLLYDSDQLIVVDALYQCTRPISIVFALQQKLFFCLAAP